MNIYQDKNRAIEERLDDLLSKMTLEEKILQTDQYFAHDFTEEDADGVVTNVNLEQLDGFLKHNSVGSIQLRGMDAQQANLVQKYAVENTRLGIPFLFSEEALHGFMSRKATCFPQQIGLAATFDPALGYRMGRGIATEARSCGVHETYSPVMDLIRDPRYGRTEESYGEDVHLCSEFAREVVKGLQGDSLTNEDCVAAEPKHYVGYGSPVAGLNCAPSSMGRHDIFAYCMPVFEAAYVDGKATDAMCSYNSIDGIPVSMDKEILTTMLRDKFGMPGFVRSDLTAVSRLYDWHFITPTKKAAIKTGLEAGVDLQLYDFPHDEWQGDILELVKSKEMSEDVVTLACRRVLRVKFMLGLFEKPYTDVTREARVMHCAEHQKTALDIARKSIVLLKNNDNLLPLSQKLKEVAVLGPAAESAMLGDYTTSPDSAHTVSVLDGIKSAVSDKTNVVFERGCNFLDDNIIPFHSAMLSTDDGKAGLTGKYFNNDSFSGEPVLTRDDLMINFNWIYVKPHPAVDSGCFSVVWTGFVQLPHDTNGCIGLSSQDSMRLYIDGKMLIDGWGEEKTSNQMIDFCFDGGKKYAVRIEYTNDMRGARVIFGHNSGRADYSAAITAAKNAEVAIVCLGDNEETSGENFDRVDLNLPGRQLEFLKKIHETGTPIVLVLQSGRPVTANWEQDNIPAILEAWFPGEKGGTAIAQTLFGENVPSGRLPITFPRSVGQIPCHYSRHPGGGWRYVEMNWFPLYPFGYGLSYTTFSYANLELSATKIAPTDTLTVSFDVTNTGKVAGEEVAQVYINDVFSSVVKPEKELAGFTRVALEVGETKRISITIGERQLRTLRADYVWEVERGEFEVMVGDNAVNVLLEGKFSVV